MLWRYDDKLYILGCRDAYGKDLIDISTFDLNTETWDTLTFKSSHVPPPRSDFAHTRIGEILIIFGGTFLIIYLWVCTTLT
jgi:hypothetical protein